MVNNSEVEKLRAQVKQLKQELKKVNKNTTSERTSTICPILFEVSPIGIASISSVGEIIEINNAFLNMLGYKREELVGTAYSNLFSEKDVGWYIKETEAVLGGKVRHCTQSYNKKCGTPIFLEISENRLSETDPNAGYISMAQDITKRVQAEEALRQEKERIQTILDTVPGEISWVNSNLKYLGVNKYLSKKQKMKKDSFSGQNVGFVRGNNNFQNFVRNFMQSDKSYTQQEVSNNIAGDKVSYIVSAKKFNNDDSAVIIGFDITNYKNSQLKLINQERFNKDLIETAPVIIITLDEPDSILEFNKYAERLTGYRKQDVVGKSWVNLFTPEQNKKRTSNILKRIFNGNNVYNGLSASILTREGKKHIISWHNELVTDPVSKKKTILAVGIDVTKNKKLENRLRHSQKMEAVGKLAGGIAHDFNNLLTIIRGYTELLLMSEQKNEAVLKKLKLIDKASHRAANLTGKLLAFSRKQVLSPIVLDVNVLIKGLHEMLKRLIDDDISIHCRMAKETWNIKADPNQFEQVIINLIVNARDAMPTGGEINIQTENLTLTKAIPVDENELSPGDYVVITVQDNGEGIPVEIHDKVFEPFFTTKDVGKGTGLGLATVYGIITQSGGNILLTSSLGIGTEFRIFLPRALDPVTRINKKTVPQQIETAHPILVVEDDPKVRALVVETLASNGYTVFEAENGEDALRVFKNNMDTIELILTDVIMPQMNGYEFTTEARRLKKEVKILFMSGYTDDIIISRGLLAHNINLIHKPFTLSDLLGKLNAVLKEEIAI